ncbi:putative NADH-ubiquinone oxidoreductase 178 kDa subunit [Aspergillus campestris IBT 28561]|uniref:NADH-ubiquinone oxidoreductase 178 kDa subunit n=1 Tax=Aspergillus campestris (strain IBT 28561) TaxID=1392248 RepID=A0A2I1DAY3_ASPC2|nr:putative NADH-ubiquinone oxidoreductase 178 kDa subunit [Aspergillus campestris IBT 28561]PKY07031.1 putative NADH-ubiquinone oxidoreductase 178 kDa subunit [Aspergillus campestris IBT 28561]
MFLARRSVASTRLLLRNQQPRRLGSHAAHAEPVNEGVGRSFYVTIGSIASGLVLYRLSQSDSPSWITNLIEKWTPSEQLFEHRNAIHTVAMEKAANDRHLFGSQGPRESYDLKQHEVSFHPGPPYNNIAGGAPDLSHVRAHYEQEHKTKEEARALRAKDGKAVSLYD